MKCFPVDADEDMDIEEDPTDSGNTAKTPSTSDVTKGTLGRSQLKCAHCEFTVGTPELLETHGRLKHLDQEWFRCKLCNFFSATTKWMDVHLSSDSHMQQEKGERSTGLASFESYVESISQGNVIIDDVAQVVADGEEVAATMIGDQIAQEAADTANAASVEEEDLEIEPPKKKRGRPKLGSTTTCGYCGLVVSNATNLTVHVRRKHSKEYGYSCTLCNYSCVTKGDMDRHCTTKKHVIRVQECANKKEVNDHSSESMQETINVQVQEPQKEQESDKTTPTECNEEEQIQLDTSQGRCNVNACSHCDFVAQSLPSLQLHVKRKHTKDFEFVCLACSYYAVTSREMSRHVNTEKHKQKSQKYLDSLESEGQKPMALPMKLKEVIEIVVQNPNSECETTSATEEPESYSDDNQVIESQDTPVVSVSKHSGDGVASVASITDEKQAENLASGVEPKRLMSEPQQTPIEFQPAVDQSVQPTEEGVEQSADEHCNVDVEAKSDSSHSDTQMSKALPFDDCIVSMKAFAVQEQMVQEGLDLKGEAAMICLTGGSPVSSSVLPSNSAYVKKLKLPKLKVKDEAKVTSSRIRCDDCGFMADGISGLNVHISMKHPSKEKHFHCLVCGKSFYTESNLHQHLTSAAHLQNEQNSVEELPEGGASFKCVKCTDRFETDHELFVHIKEKHEELLREVNKYVLEDTEQINREREENQGSVCKYCGKVCKSSNSMAFLAHIRTHTGMYP